MATGSLIIAVAALVIAAISVLGGVAELFMQRILVDKDTGQIVEVEVPLFGKVKSNYPSIGAIFIGAALVVGVLQWTTLERDKMPFTTTVTVLGSDNGPRRTADVFVNAVPKRYRQARSRVTVNEPTDIHMNVDRDENYDVLVFTPVKINANGSTERVLTFGPMDYDQNGGFYPAELDLR